MRMRRMSGVSPMSDVMVGVVFDGLLTMTRMKTVTVTGSQKRVTTMMRQRQTMFSFPRLYSRGGG